MGAIANNLIYLNAGQDWLMVAVLGFFGVVFSATTFILSLMAFFFSRNRSQHLMECHSEAVEKESEDNKN